MESFTEHEYDEPVELETLVLSIGDRVLLTTADQLKPEEARPIIESLRERFPGIEFTLVGGITGIAIQ